MKNRQSPSAASIASRCQYDCVAPVPLRGQKIVGEWRERASSSCSLRSRRRRGGSEVRGERIEVRKPRSPSRPLSLSRFLDVLFALQTSYLSPPLASGPLYQGWVHAPGRGTKDGFAAFGAPLGGGRRTEDVSFALPSFSLLSFEKRRNTKVRGVFSV